MHQRPQESPTGRLFAPLRPAPYRQVAPFVFAPPSIAQVFRFPPGPPSVAEGGLLQDWLAA